MIELLSTFRTCIEINQQLHPPIQVIILNTKFYTETVKINKIINHIEYKICLYAFYMILIYLAEFAQYLLTS